MAVDKAKTIKLGNPLDPSTDQGPMISSKRFESVMKYI